MEPFVLQNQSYFLIKKWTDQFQGLIAGITTKKDGFSKGDYKSLNLGFHVGDHYYDVCSNRQRLSEQINFPLNYWIGAEQTHGIVIKKVTKSDRGKGSASYQNAIKGTDGFYTNERGILLTLCYADCVPLFFIAPNRGMIGAAHAGWKGTVQQIATRMVNTWGQEGIPPEEIFVVIGPSICKKCYIVDKHVINIVQNILEGVEKKPYNFIQDGQYILDLCEVNRLLLQKAGVIEQNMLITNYCTSCNRDEFFSHRRDHGHTGRMLSFIGWKEDSCQ